MPVEPDTIRLRLPAFLALSGGTITIVATLLQWPSLGRTRQNGFRLAESLASLSNVLDLPNVRVVAALWYLIPLTAGIALVALAIDRPIAWAGSFVVHVVAVVVAGATTWAARTVGLGGGGVGPVLAIVGTVVGASAAGFGWRQSCREG